MMRALDKAAELYGRAVGDDEKKAASGKLASHVKVIRRRLARGDSVGEVARSYGVQRAAIRSIRDGRSYPEDE